MQTPNDRRQQLPVLTRLPSEKELIGMLHQSITKRGEMLELPIDIEPAVRLRLQAVVGRRAGEEAPTWYLYMDNYGDQQPLADATQAQPRPIDSKLEWIHQSGDMEHIYSLLQTSVQQFDRESLADSLDKPAFTPFNPSQPVVKAEDEPGVFDGDLTRLPVEALLQSITSSKMTGKLECRNSKKTISVFFESGNPKNAYTGRTVGEEAIIDLMTWKEGTFSFYPNQTIEERTILKPINALLLEAATLTDFTTFLEKAGLRGDSILCRAAVLSEDEFEERLKKAVPVEMNRQKSFYQAIDGTRSLAAIIENKYSRSQWVPLVYNLVANGIVTIKKAQNSRVNQGSVDDERTDLELNRTTIDSFARSHIYSDSGVISYVAFLYFIEQEFYRFECFRSPFSLVLLKPGLRVENGSSEESQLDKETLQEVIKRVNHTKRKADLLAHYQHDSYALLLPHTNLQGVTAFAGRLVGALMTNPPRPVCTDGADQKKLVVTVGIASLPENCESWVSLVAHMHNNQRRF
jgi:hypothetical protein